MFHKHFEITTLCSPKFACCRHSSLQDLYSYDFEYHLNSCYFIFNSIWCRAVSFLYLFGPPPIHSRLNTQQEIGKNLNSRIVISSCLVFRHQRHLHNQVNFGEITLLSLSYSFCHFMHKRS